MKKLLLTLIILIGIQAYGQKMEPGIDEKYTPKTSVVWDSPSLNSLGSMPAGNGDIGINLWVEGNGDLLFYISKTDAWSENARLLKIGKVRLSLSPNPFKTGSPFSQELVLEDGVIHIEAGEKEEKVAIDVWVDANNPLIELDINSQQAIVAHLSTEPWRTHSREITDKNEIHSAYGLQSALVSKDSIIDADQSHVIWAHRNEKSVWRSNMKLQGLEGYMHESEDPLLNRTFGALIQSDQLQKVSPYKLENKDPAKELSASIVVHTAQTETMNDWIGEIQHIATNIDSEPKDERRIRHEAWWKAFWNRSYIHVSTQVESEKEKVFNVSRGYTLQRYMNACSGRGNSPIKFNGSIFTVDTKDLQGKLNGFDADYRQWGGPYGLGKDDLELARRTFENRLIKQTGGWQQNAIKAALLGLTEEAAKLTAQNFNSSNPQFRFPVMWGPNYDWIPDQDHGSVALIALQRMLLQYDGDKIYLLPAWPDSWDVDFKLVAPKNTIIEATLKNGEITQLKVTPVEREKDVILKMPYALGQNLAPMASVQGKGTNPGAIADGIFQSAGNGEWFANTKAYWWGEIDFPEITLTWDDPQLISKITIFDRPGLQNHAAACQLVFADGSKEQIWAIPNDGSPRSISFTPRLSDFVRIEIVDGLGDHIGLSEVQVFLEKNTSEEKAEKKQFSDWVSYVDPTIESGRGRWFFCVPGSRPFGMISAAAHTRNKAQGGGGYNYNSTEILGFSQIHNWVMAGISIMPVTEDLFPNEGEQSWKSSFSHDSEIIEPGYHKVFLDRYQTQVEYTSTERVAFYRMVYSEKNMARLLVSLGGSMGPLSCVDAKVQWISENQIAGSVGMTDRIWGGPEISHAYFVLEMDHPMVQMDGWIGQSESLLDIKSFNNPVSQERLSSDKRDYLFKNLPSEQAGVSLAYNVTPGDTVLIKIGISYTSIENARSNLQGECPHWDFDQIRNDSRRVWNDWLGKIKVKGGKVETRVKFYTDLWHVLLGRHKIDDLNGDYPNLMGEPKTLTLPKNLSGQVMFHMYNFDALWLTMWNLNILWGIAWPEMLDEFSASLVQYADNGGKLPRGPCSGEYTGIMTGCPGTSMITATWQKGLLTKVSKERAYEAMKKSHPLQIRGDEHSPGLLVQGGFEYWALAQMAEEIGETQDLEEFYEWSEKWKVCYNPKYKLLMGKGVDNPLSGKGWIEANAWQGTFGVSHDIAGLSSLMGGKDSLAEKLNYAFDQAAAKDFVFGYGGGYVSYANQPGCSGAHVFNHTGHPWLSQYWVRRVSRQAYGGTNPNLGYGGHDEDQGQMGGVSALMKLGLFSLRGTSSRNPIYEITAPEFDEIEIELDPRYYPGKTFIIRTIGEPENHFYIQKAKLNGKALNNCWFSHADFAKGGLLELWVGPKANRQWGDSPIKIKL